MRADRFSLAMFGIALAGCAEPAPPAAPLPPVTVSYDGRYQGTMRVSGSAASMNLKDCATTPRFTIEVRNNRFSLPLGHPEAVVATPTLADSASALYQATIQPDGSIAGKSEKNNTVMDGRMLGGHMSGQIYGLLCYYAFDADRV